MANELFGRTLASEREHAGTVLLNFRAQATGIEVLG
jgi:hypothetical protein